MAAYPDPEFILGWTSQNLNSTPTSKGNFAVAASVVNETQKPTSGQGTIVQGANAD